MLKNAMLIITCGFCFVLAAQQQDDSTSLKNGNPNLTLSLYFKEDFRVNNAADFQTGVSLKVPVFK